MKVCPKSVCISTVGVRKDLFNRNPNLVPITDFFGSVRPVQLVTEVADIGPLLDVTLVNNATVTTQESIKKKPKKFRYVPPLVNFNTLIR